MKTINVFKIKVGCPDLANEIMSGFTSIVVGDEIMNIIFNSVNETEDMVFCFLPEEKQTQILNLFIDYGVLVSFFDITQDVLMQKETGMILECPTEIKLVRDFINDFLTSDTVLDKINELGIKSLNEIDYRVLRNENPQL